jgi:hydrogenase-4 component F
MMGLLSVVLPMMGAPAVRLSPLRGRATLLLVGVAFLDALVGLFLALSVQSETPSTYLDGFFVVDATSRLFLLLINLIFFGIATYVWTRVRTDRRLEQDIARYVGFALAFIGACNLAVLSNRGPERCWRR